jgi:CHAT domain-containing protein/tetratricopeptide (TPR) repeat protein
LAGLILAGRAYAGASPSLEDSVRVLYLRGQPLQAEPRLEQVLSAPFRHTRADSLKRAAWLDLLAEAQWRIRHSKAPAESIAQLAVDMRRALHGPSSDELSRSLATQARVWRITLSGDSCVAGLERALAMHERYVPRPDTVSADMLVSMGNALRDLGRVDEAIGVQEKAVTIRRVMLGDAHRDVGRALINLGLTYMAAGHPQRRIEVEREAIEILEHTSPLDSLGVYTTNQNHVGVLFDEYRGAEAGPYMARCVELCPRLFPPGSQEDADTEENAGTYQMIAGDLVSSRRHFDRCGEIYRARGPGLSASTRARYWLNRSKMEEVSGQLDSALVCVRRAAQIFGGIYQSHHDRFGIGPWAATLDRLGQVLAFHDSLAAAEQAFVTSANLDLAVDGPESANAARLLQEVAGVRLQMGFWDSAAAPALRSAEILTRHVRAEFAHMTEDEALRYRGSGATAALNVLLSIASAHPDSTLILAVWDAVVRDAGLVAAEVAARRRLLSATHDSLLAIWASDLVRERSRLGELELKSSPSPVADSVRARAMVLEQRLAARSARLASDFSAGEASAAAVADALPSDACLVHFVRFLRSGPSVPGFSAPKATASAEGRRVAGPALPWYGVFVLTPGQATPWYSPLGPASTIEADADRWQRSLALGSAPDMHALKAGRDLRSRLWEPVADHLGKCRIALLVPDGPLAVLPFATLPARGGGPLLEHAPTLHMLGSPRELLAPVPSAGGERALVVGGADYGARLENGSSSAGASPRLRGRSKDCRDLAPNAYEALPGSFEEANRVAQSWDGRHILRAELLTGAQASEAHVRAHIAGCGLIHLATHGYLVPDSCENSKASELTLVGDLRGIRLPPGAGEAMLRSGLVLAGANTRADDPANDGVLTAADIAMLDLSSAKLVTLSACESGMGTVVDAEGVIGLRWALMQAGARSSLTSCHRVSDEMTGRWMDLFYAGWIDGGLSVPEAAREASRHLRRELMEHGQADIPGAWGAFVTAGDWR